MTQTAEAKLVELAKAYARHRKALRDNSQAIRDVQAGTDTYIDMKPYRQEYIDGEREAATQPGAHVEWYGWLHAVDSVINNRCDEEDHPEYQLYRDVARLMDERKEINAQGARIRNRLRIIGDQLLRAEP
jgi:hypothetical protein